MSIGGCLGINVSCSINDKNLNYEIETYDWKPVSESSFAINDKNLNYEIET